MAHTADMHTQAQIYPPRHTCHKDSSHYKVANRYELTIDEISDSSPIVH